MESLEPLDRAFVIVEGQINVNNKGHRGMYGAALENVNLMQYRYREYGTRESESVTEMSLFALLGSPVDWDEMPINVSGFMRNDGRPGSGLYATSEHCERSMYQYSISIMLDGTNPSTDWSEIPFETDCNFATLEGDFFGSPALPISPDVIRSRIPKPGHIEVHWMRIE